MALFYSKTIVNLSDSGVVLQSVAESGVVLQWLRVAGVYVCACMAYMCICICV